MAWDESARYITLAADEDLSSKQFFIVAASTDGQAKSVATRGATLIGVNVSESTAAGISSLIQISGVARVAAGDTSGGAAIAAGDILMSSSVGRAVATTVNIGDQVFATALSALAASNTGIISALLWGGPRPSSS